jgi:cysteinyl-tRNA synthetase
MGTYNKLKNRVAGLAKEGVVDEAAVAEFKIKFVEAVGNDVNTSMGITLLYDVLKADVNDVTKRAIIGSFDEVLGLGLLKEEAMEEPAVDAELEAYVLAKIEERKAAKKEKNFALADAIRAELLEKGIEIKDTREGVVWKLI